MMLVTYEDGGPRVGLAADGRLVPLDTLRPAAPGAARLTMNDVIDAWADWLGPVQDALARIARDPKSAGAPFPGPRLYAPIPRTRRNPFLVAGNYMAHVLAGEKASGVPYSQRKQAIFFTKPSGALAGPEDDVVYDPRLTQQLDYEVELVVVIGRRGRDIARDDALSHVWGWTIGNDISARDIQRQQPTPDFLRGKGLDTFFPLGPGLVPREFLPEYRDRAIRLSLNGERRQDASTSDMIRDVPDLIAELSRGLTLEVGDLIATGTPNGVLGETNGPYLKDGDEIVSEIEGLGRLVNRVRARG